ncbi:hypothetical protein F383_03716 [Gossypium arboreum]|uniref:Uncharacterized protein n=1 Tax=Gossypium arboreum TaxID=29729 RepID=A0A0B0P977_GOSAR|nr:hypothetical protein F383_03716 [Gossypium arboreum]
MFTKNLIRKFTKNHIGNLQIANIRKFKQTLSRSSQRVN